MLSGPQVAGGSCVGQPSYQPLERVVACVGGLSQTVESRRHWLWGREGGGRIGGDWGVRGRGARKRGKQEESVRPEDLYESIRGKKS